MKTTCSGRPVGVRLPAILTGALVATAVIDSSRAQSPEIVVATGLGYTSLDPYTGINEAGDIAFTGVDSVGSRAFVITPAGLVSPVTFSNPTRLFSGAAINDAIPAAVATRDRLSGAPPTFFIRSWPATGTLAFTVVGRSPTHFDSALPFIDINDSGVTAYSGLINNSTSVALLAGTGEPPMQLAVFPNSASTFVRPQISNNNLIVIRDNQNRILRYTYPAGGPITVAGTGQGFASVGPEPGISRDGSVVAFSGVRGAGEGVFVSIEHGAVRELVRVAGEFQDGFTDIDTDQRVGIASSGTLSAGLTGAVVFIGTQNGIQGVYRVEFSAHEDPMDVNVVHATVETPLPMAQVGESLAGRVFSSFRLFDPINLDRTVVFWAGFSDGSSGVVRAPACDDADEDGLCDDWEENGVPVAGQVTRLMLPEADTNRKDLFVEVDAMSGLAPQQAALDDVIAAFAASPVVGGIRLHVSVDETGLVAADWPDAWAGFDAVKMSHFGTPMQQNDANSDNLLAAKRRAYRYCVFAKRYLADDGAWDHSGLAELPGNDFMVTLGDAAWVTGYAGTELRQAQASTFMHELGHTLGLRHGGNDDIHHKPNYYSVMNYTWQIRLRQNSVHGSSLLQAFRNSWRLDYSRSELPTLNEAALVETDGIGGDSSKRVLVGPTNLPLNRRIVRMGGAVDWNRDGDTMDLTVMRDLNWDSFFSPPLTGFDDWAADLHYGLSGGSDFEDGVHETSDDFTEIGALDVEEMFAFRLGDMNCDGLVNNFDIDAFVLAISDSVSYQSTYPMCNIDNADIDGDGLVNNFDVDPFVALLSGD